MTSGSWCGVVWCGGVGWGGGWGGGVVVVVWWCGGVVVWWCGVVWVSGRLTARRARRARARALTARRLYIGKQGDMFAQYL